MLQTLPRPAQMLQRLDVSIANDDVGFAADERRDERWNITARVLIVAIGVDDEIGAEFQGRVDAGRERGGKAAPACVAR